MEMPAATVACLQDRHGAGGPATAAACRVVVTSDRDCRISGPDLQASASAPTMILELPRCRPPAIARRRSASAPIDSVRCPAGSAAARVRRRELRSLASPRSRGASSLLGSRCSPASLRRSGPPAPRTRAGRRVLSPRRCPLRSCRSMRARWASSPKSSRA